MTDLGASPERQTGSFVYFPETPWVVLGATGADTADFLHRLSATDLKSRDNGTATYALFLRGDGRLVADCIVIRLAADSFLLVTDARFSGPLHSLLDKFLFTEKVELCIKEAVRVVEISGQAPGEVWELLSVAQPQLNKATGNASGKIAAFVSFPNASVRSIAILPEAVYQDLQAQLYQSVSLAGGVVGSAQLREEIRVREGLAGAGFELTESLIPLEAGLRDAVSFTKGCFPGQEVMARIDTLGHPANALVRLKIQHTASSLCGSLLEADGKIVGRVTSHVIGLESSYSFGLGFIKWAHRNSSDPLFVRHPDYPPVSAHIIDEAKESK